MHFPGFILCQFTRTLTIKANTHILVYQLAKQQALLGAMSQIKLRRIAPSAAND